MGLKLTLDDVRRFINAAKVPDEDRIVGRAAIETFERLRNSDSYSADELIPIVAAIRSRFMAIWQEGARLLMYLAVTNQTAQAVLLRQLDQSRSTERFPVVTCLSRDIPREIRIELLSRALRDSSSRIRLFAATRINDHGLAELIDDLQEAANRETHPSTRKAMANYLGQLRDGYVIEQSDNGHLFVQFTYYKNGWTCSTSVPVSPEQAADPAEILRVIEERKARAY